VLVSRLLVAEVVAGLVEVPFVAHCEILEGEPRKIEVVVLRFFIFCEL
jgi:hypothetical protein